MTKEQLKAVEIARIYLDASHEKCDIFGWQYLEMLEKTALGYALHKFLKAEPKNLTSGAFWKALEKPKSYVPSFSEKQEIADLVMQRHDLDSLWEHGISVKNEK